MSETRRKSFHGGLYFLIRDKHNLTKQEKAQAAKPRTERRNTK